jgi:hypothetical protein
MMTLTKPQLNSRFDTVSVISFLEHFFEQRSAEDGICIRQAKEEMFAENGLTSESSYTALYRRAFLVGA